MFKFFYKLFQVNGWKAVKKDIYGWKLAMFDNLIKEDVSWLLQNLIQSLQEKWLTKMCFQKSKTKNSLKIHEVCN